MLSAKTIKELAVLLKVTETQLTDILKAEEEKDIEVPEGTVFAKSELETRDKSVRSAAYQEGKDVGIEMFVKDQKKELGLEFEGKDGKSLIAAIQATKGTGTEDDKKTISALQKTIHDTEAKVTAAETALEDMKHASKLQSLIPGNTRYQDKEEAVAILKVKGYSFLEENGTMVAKLNGEVVKDDKMQTPLAASDVITKFFTERGDIKDIEEEKKGGRGGKSSKVNGVVSTLSDLQKAYAEEHGEAALQGSGFQAAVQEAMKADASFDMNK